jgi:signal transduction histidine kinase
VNIYSKKQVWKASLLFIAIVIGFGSLWYTNDLVRKLSAEEKKKVQTWAEAFSIIAQPETPETVIPFALKILVENETVPVIVVDSAGSVVAMRNLDSLRMTDPVYQKEQLAEMKEQRDPIKITLSEGVYQYCYYKDSLILTQLTWYPFVQLGVISLFILVAYLAFSASRKAEQNQVWVGMAKETAHQLGTPISSMLAWVELLKLKNADPEVISEMEKDVQRLETITERFSKIGSAPVLTPVNILDVIDEGVNYVRTRTSSSVSIRVVKPPVNEIIVPLNVALFEWVFENLCKNAIDAMNGEGFIEISLFDQMQVLFIDVRDSGKGIPKSRYKTVFRPGFTTKKRGWGLGLSLSKRIIEEYHQGKIFVKSSEVNNGTTFRITLNK